VRKRILIVTGFVLLAGVLAPLAAAVSVSVRIEGKTRNLYGHREPRLQVKSSALDALVAAATKGEIYYHLAASSFGTYVDQIGFYPATGSSGWMFKVNGVSPSVGADSVTLKNGDRVLWYWAGFDPVTYAGPKTLRLSRSKPTRAERRKARRRHQKKLRCYAVSAQDDHGARTRAEGAVLHIGSSRRRKTTKGRACLGAHKGSIVVATLKGAVRSNALP
jgi:hypothetical protein